MSRELPDVARWKSFWDDGVGGPVGFETKRIGDAAIAALEAGKQEQIERREAEKLRAVLAEATIKRIRQSVVHHKQEAALYNNEREYDCLTAVLRIIDKEED